MVLWKALNFVKQYWIITYLVCTFVKLLELTKTICYYIPLWVCRYKIKTLAVSFVNKPFNEYIFPFKQLFTQPELYRYSVVQFHKSRKFFKNGSCDVVVVFTPINQNSFSETGFLNPIQLNMDNRFLASMSKNQYISGELCWNIFQTSFSEIQYILSMDRCKGHIIYIAGQHELIVLLKLFLWIYMKTNPTSQHII